MSTHYAEQPSEPLRLPPTDAERRGGPEPAHTYVRELASAIVTVAAALPIALVWGEGLVMAAGVVYAAVWMLVLAPSTAVYLTMLLDSFLLFMRRRPILLPALMEAAIERGRTLGYSSQMNMRGA
jgi:hypothetical protein